MFQFVRLAGAGIAAVGLAAFSMLSPATRAADAASGVRLYAMDCGRIVFKDMSLFSDTGDYDGKPGSVAAPCFLVRHPRGTLLWDTGLGDKLAGNHDGVDSNGIRLYVDHPLTGQLAQLGIKPEDITLLAFSHFHFDHTGNANLFTHATWFLNKAELDAALGPNPPFGVDKSLISGYEHVPTHMIDGDYDVFGDGTVKILKAPGHTPGHQVLELQLAHAGTVLLSGDLYHTRENRQFKRVPPINTERADTLASIDRFEKLAARTHARVVIQHSPEDFAAFPKFPAYLD